MKIVECEKEHVEGYSINFIDENDNFVGWDNETQCCEDYVYLITDSEVWGGRDPDNKVTDPSKLDGYMFDTEYLVIVHREFEDEYYDCATRVIFRLKKVNCKSLYLHLRNAHNGYYAHGFKFVVDCMIKY